MRRRTRTLWRWSALVVAGAVALVSPLGAASATAAPAATNWWWDTYEVQSVQDQGLTGKGVKIAVVDGNINPNLPAFSGRSLRVDDRPVCAEATSATTTETSPYAVHGSTLVASLIGNGQGPGGIRGIAPDADVTFYSLGQTTDGGACTAPFDGVLSTPFVGLQRAIDDGAQIVTISVGGNPLGSRDDDAEIIANALAKGVIVVIAGNNPKTDTVLNGLDTLNGVVVAAAVDSKGALQTTENGQPFIVTATTVVAAGVGLPTLGRTGGSWDESGTASGSSFAAPLVAGMLAVVKQKYPDATSNQLLQSLIRNTGRDDGPLTYDPASGYGYGPAWLTHMLRKDPTQYPDENPLMNKGERAAPTAEQVAAAAARGSVYPIDATPRATAPTDTPTATPPPVAPPIGPLLLIVLVVLGIVIIGAVITIVIVITTRKKRTAQGGPS